MWTVETVSCACLSAWTGLGVAVLSEVRIQEGKSECGQCGLGSEVCFPLGPLGSSASGFCQGGVRGLELSRVTCPLEPQSSGLDLSLGRFKNKT